ncbi:MAG: HAD-IB family phosphatase [Anaerolineales bacterium]
MSPKPISRLQSFQHVIFDCDSTLSTIEGIDELARIKGQFESIAELTRKAMDGEIDLEAVYNYRLEKLQPTRGDLRLIARAYSENMVPNARAVIGALKAAGCEVSIISGGLLQAVLKFGRWLGVSSDNVRAVPIKFDQLSGEWWRFNQYGGNPEEHFLDTAPTPLIETDGKRTVIKELAGNEPRTMFVGDGFTDLAARQTVKLFVGFGGVVRREQVAAEADVYIESPGLEAIVPLALSEGRAKQLQGTEHEKVYQEGIETIKKGLVLFNRQTLKHQIDARLKGFETIDDPTIDLLNLTRNNL